MAVESFWQLVGKGYQQALSNMPSIACQHGQQTPCTRDMGVLAFTKMDEDLALHDVHTLMVAKTFAGEDNTTQHWPDGSCYGRKKVYFENKKEIM